MNPIRYRGYYYDGESGLYYVSSRYFDARTGRFISPDNPDVLSATQAKLRDKNLYAYCDNNPVVRKGVGGQFWIQVGATIVGGILSAGFEVARQLAAGNQLDEINWTSVAIEAVSGAATGLLMSVGAPASIVTAGRMVINSATSVAHSINEGDSVGETIMKATISATTTFVTGNLNYIGQQWTKGRHLQLNGVNKMIKSIANKPRNEISIIPVVMNRTIRAIMRVLT